jgi:AcrR family transcriptional regulator
MPRKPGTRQGDTIKDIREAAFALFGRYGYDGVSIGDIAGAAGLSKGALYWHFSGKNDLFLDCLKRLHQILEDTIFVPMQAEPDPIRRILLLFQSLSVLLQQPHIVEGIGGYWLGANNTRLGEIQTTQRDFEERTAGIIRETLIESMQQGSLDLQDEVGDMSRAIIVLLEAIILPLRHQSSEEIHRILGVLARTLFRAYATSDEVVALAEQF